jgi:hypothetical protein
MGNHRRAPPRVREEFRNFLRSRRCAIVVAEIYDSAETLDPCAFLQHRKKRTASPKSSRVQIARAMNCIALVQATRRVIARVGHFSLSRFGFF